MGVEPMSEVLQATTYPLSHRLYVFWRMEWVSNSRYLLGTTD